MKEISDQPWLRSSRPHTDIPGQSSSWLSGHSRSAPRVLLGGDTEIQVSNPGFAYMKVQCI